MKTFLFVILSSVFLVAQGLPSFEWQKERKSNAGIPLLTIKFPSGEEDHAILEAVNPIAQLENERSEDVDNCIFSGHLQNEPSVTVTLAGGCPNEDNFEIMLNTPRLNGHMFKVENGIVRKLESPYNDMSRESFMGNDQVSPPVVGILNDTISTNRLLALPSAGFFVKVKVFYDQLFKARWGLGSNNAVRRVIAFAQGMYRWSSLTTTLKLNLGSIAETKLSVTGGASFENLKKVSTLSVDPNINVNIYLTYEKDQPGTVGIAWTGTVCATPYSRTALCEYYSTDVQSAQVVAHEFGHNLGMLHDFGPSGVQRVDSNQNSCTDIGGIMDYDQVSFSLWSTCSVQDFTALYNKNQPFCLKTGSGLSPTESTPTDPCRTYFLTGCSGLCKNYNFDASVICQGTIKTTKVDCNCGLYAPTR